MAVAHDEDVVGWASMSVQWLELRQRSEPISLIQLQQELGIPLVEVWLGLLLSRGQQYRFQQRGEFYDIDGIWLEIN